MGGVVSKAMDVRCLKQIERTRRFLYGGCKEQLFLAAQSTSPRATATLCFVTVDL